MTEPPCNLDAERSVLGAMMVTERAVRAVLGASPLRGEHFYSDRHRFIFGAASRLAALDNPVDAISVTEELKRTNKLEPSGGESYVSDLASHVSVAGNALHYAEIVTELAELRAKLEGAHKIIHGVNERDPDTIRAGLELAHADYSHAAEPVEPMELADEFAEELFSDDPVTVFELPWKRMNGLIGGGLYPGEVSALIGWPGHGKTTMLDQTFAYMNKSGAKCLILATEMSRKERIARFCSAITGLPFARIMLKDLTDDEKGKVIQALNDLPYSYRKIKGWSADQIATEIAMRRPDLVAIDSIHGLDYKDAGELRRLCGKLAATASNVGCHMIWVCQLNMARAKEETKPPPVKRDIRDSSQIEQDANTILSIYRNQDKEGNDLDTGLIKALKARNGLSGSKIRVELIPGSYGFRPIGGRPAPAPEPETEPLASVTDD